jgi:hypothetical protein
MDDLAGGEVGQGMKDTRQTAAVPYLVSYILYLVSCIFLLTPAAENGIM